LLQDSALNAEQWLLLKVSSGFRDAISAAIMGGDGMGRPMGILNPNSGIPVCDVGVATPPGSFTWQDLVSLAYEVPIQWHAGASFLMNQRTMALCLTMSDGIGRPLLLPTPLTELAQPVGARFTIAGFPVVMNSFMPDIEPGSTPIAFGNWNETYTLVTRRATSMMADPYSAQYCVLFRFESRVGGAITCPNSARLLRVE
jgi:HK97 family phage major capsid protein